MIIGFLSALLFYGIPIFVGRAFSLVVAKTKLNQPQKHSPYVVVTYFILGGLILFSLALLTQYVISPFSHVSFATLFKPSVIGVIIVAGILNGIYRSTLSRPSAKSLVTSVFFVVLGVATYYLWLIKSPYPLNWDFLEHQTIITTILRGNFSFVTTQLSDTFGFNSYSSMPHLLLAISQLFTAPSTIAFWQSISGIHLIFVIAASYFLMKEITGRKLPAVISSVLGAVVFEQVTYTSLFFIPQTFTAVTFIFLFTQCIYNYKNGIKTSGAITALSLVFLILNHYIVGTAGAGLYIVLLLYFRFKNSINELLIRNYIIIAIVGTVLTCLTLFVTTKLNLGFINQGEGEAFTFSLPDKFSFMQQAYGYSLLVLFPWGIVTVMRRKKFEEILLSTIAIWFVFITLLQLPYFLKFYVIGRFFVHGVMSLGLLYFLDQLTHKVGKGIGIITIIAGLFIIYILNISYWKSILRYNEIVTNISPNEIHAAEFLKTHYPTNTLLISDPATANIFEGLSGLNTQGGAFASTSTRQDLIESFNNAQAEAGSYTTPLLHIKDRLQNSPQTRLLVLGGRYFAWQKATQKQKLGIDFNIWAPYNLSFDDRVFIDKLASNNPNLKLIYYNSTLAIFELNPLD